VERPGAEEIAAIQEAVLEWARDDNLREFSWREDATPYEVLVAEILLQQTFADKVEPAYDALLEAYPTPAAQAAASPEAVAEIIESLGFQNQRARALVENASVIAERGNVPETEADLKTLNFVGDYAANATLCFGYGQQRPILDTNVKRVYDRVFDVNLDADDADSWAFVADLVPPDEFVTYNLALLDIGAKICKPSTPACEECPLRQHCEYVQ
jgi:A/G-specific adenine glycosylase